MVRLRMRLFGRCMLGIRQNIVVGTCMDIEIESGTCHTVMARFELESDDDSEAPVFGALSAEFFSARMTSHWTRRHYSDSFPFVCKSFSDSPQLLLYARHAKMSFIQT